MSSNKAGDDAERARAWIANHTQLEGGTGSKCEQLLKRKVPLTFKKTYPVNKWDEKLESLKTFIAIVGRPRKNAADDRERSLRA
jgi:hypothetical protein